MAGVENGAFRIAHISDLHCGGPHFVPTLLERAISEINDMRAGHRRLLRRPDDFGFKPRVRPGQVLPGQDRVRVARDLPGNHDARNVGYVHFEEMFGDRSSVLHVGDVSVVAVDSTEPDLDHGADRPRPLPVDRGAVLAARRRSGSSSSTTTCCRYPEPGASGTSSTTPATRSSACCAPASTSCSAATSTCRTRGAWRTCSSSTPAPSPRCACAATRGPVTTSSRSTARRSRSGASTRTTGAT